MWVFKIQIDRHIKHNTPGITVTAKKQKKKRFTDEAVPRDSLIDENQLEKITEYCDFKIKVKTIMVKNISYHANYSHNLIYFQNV